MYDELIKALRGCVLSKPCDACPYYDPNGQTKECATLNIAAADAIEELSMKLHGDEAAICGMKREIERMVVAGKPRWIPVTERLPEDGIEVNIVWCNRSPIIYYQHIKDKPQTATGVFFRGKWYWWSAVVQDYLAEYGEWEPDKMDVAIEVTHWMPLPKPPKEET